MSALYRTINRQHFVTLAQTLQERLTQADDAHAYRTIQQKAELAITRCAHGDITILFRQLIDHCRAALDALSHDS